MASKRLMITPRQRKWLREYILKYSHQRLATLIGLMGLILAFATPIHWSVPPVQLTPEIPVTPETSTEPSLFDPFPYSDELATQMNFWRRIFTQYTSKQAVIHDDWYVDVVYEVVNVMDPVYGSEKEGWKAARDAQEKYVKILTSLADHWGNAKNMTETEQQIYELFKEIPESEYFKKTDAKDRVRIQVGQADRFKDGIIWAGQYLPTMKQIFREAGLPENLAYLPLIESAFNPHAHSFVGAAGMWQFMRMTGKEYHLTINPTVDERKDPLRSTRAAAKLLGHNYEVIQSWPLAITAYNHGLQGMKNAARAVNSEDIATIIEQYKGKAFGFSSRNFYVEFLAAVDVCQQYTKYFGEIEPEQPLALSEIKLPDYISAKTLEKYTPLTTKQIRELNPALHASAFNSNGFIPKGYVLNVPEEHKTEFETRYAAIPQTLKFAYLPVKSIHIVKKGEALSSIAKRYDVSQKALMAANNIKDAKKIRIGQKLKVPGGYAPVSENETMVVSSAPSAENSGKTDEKTAATTKSYFHKHTIKEGETLISIAKRYHLEVEEVLKANDLKKSQTIKIGQTLKIPAFEPRATQADKRSVATATDKKKKEHLVEKGQTLSMIAQLYKTSAKAIAKANAITNPRQIRPGQKLIIPEG
ncbi:lytic transglycosylase [Candidatus Moduliflexus flocculans]|uniref:Lytic transglycosylase n=1 Tax=Candidatus Moduliflexus flocculans TaxID=1499966 RepID=A0A081BLJ0_9BACT|nr:lytic transglycosylase [Candidatus Moduliflexus flocculans]